jgi:pilus assembly protein CpaD
MIALARKDRSAMFRTNPLPLALAAAAALCGTAAASAERGEGNRSLYSLNQPVVQRTDYVLDVASQGGGLSATDRGRLAEWLESLGLGYGDRLYVDADYSDAEARSDIAQLAAGYGMMLSRGAPVTPGVVQPGTVRVIVSRTEASVPGCPNWDNPTGPSATSTNYGCGVNSNLAAMVADANDLVLGQTGDASGDAATASKAIRAYRSAAPTGTGGLKDTITKGGK